MRNTTQNSRVFIDANVLVEVLESRPKQHKATRVIKQCAGAACISTLTCHIVAYVCTKRLGLPLIEQFLADYQHLDLLKEDVEWAFRNRLNSDFEDALQLAVAVRHGCDEFITFDVPLYRAYKDLTAISIRLLS